MTDQLARLTDADLQTLAAALRSGRLVAPITPIAIQRFVSPGIADEATREIESGRQSSSLADRTTQSFLNN